MNSQWRPAPAPPHPPLHQHRPPTTPTLPPTPTTAMATYTPASLETLLKNLALSDPDHALILEHCNKVLSTTKAHPRALHTKLVALLNLDRYDEAWQIFDSPDATAVANATLERAYCLYKLGRLGEAQAVAKVAADADDRNGRGLRHMEAQAVSFFLPFFVRGGC